MKENLDCWEIEKKMISSSKIGLKFCKFALQWVVKVEFQIFKFWFAWKKVDSIKLDSPVDYGEKCA